MPNFDLKVKMLDTLNWWKFGDHKNYVSLNLLAHVLGIPSSKTDIDGSMVQDVYYQENDLPRIVEYCQRDVVVTANIILRFQHLPPLKPENIFIVNWNLQYFKFKHVCPLAIGYVHN